MVADNGNGAEQQPGDLTPEEAQRIEAELRKMATEALAEARKGIDLLAQMPRSGTATGNAIAALFENMELQLRANITELEERMPGGPVRPGEFDEPPEDDASGVA